MSSRVLLVGLALAVITGSSASAATIKLGDPSWGRAGTGGEFRVYGTTGYVGETGLAADAAYTGAQAGSWGTFCVELGEHIALGTPYNVTIAPWAIAGSIPTGAGSGPGGAGTDDLESQTAFLYNAFRKGTLDNYQAAAAGGAFGAALDAMADAAGTFHYAAGTDRRDDTKQLQGAIWRFEEGTKNGVSGAMVDFLIALADYHVAAGGDWAGKGIGNVRIMNLDEGGVLKQSQLTIIPLPNAAGMGLAGLIGVLAIRRRVRL